MLLAMTALTAADLARAQEFIWRTARVLEARRFEHLTGRGPAESVLRALLAYHNNDGGFGHALEPDGRGPSSQPLHDLSALRLLAEIDLAPSTVVGQICEHLVAITRQDGGVPMVDPAIARHPHAPWWALPTDDRGSLLLTTQLAGALHALKAEHPWLVAATEFCWSGLDALTTTHPYEAAGAITFLDHVPDRQRAERCAGRLGELVRAQGLVDLSASGATGADAAPGYAAGEVHGPTDYAPHPASLARRWFSDAEFDAALDALVAEQHADGAWPVKWGIWTPVTEFEWRPIVTIEAIRTLAAHSRLTPPL